MPPAFENCFVVPLLHKRSDDSFRFAVCLRGLDFCESLLNLVFSACLHKGVSIGSAVFQSIVGVYLFNRIGAFVYYLLQERLCRVLRLIRKDCAAYSSREKSSMPTKRYSRVSCECSPSRSGRRFVSTCTISPGYALLYRFACFLSFSSSSRSTFWKTLDAVFQTPKSLVDAFVYTVILQPSAMDDFVDGRARHLILPR